MNDLKTRVQAWLMNFNGQNENDAGLSFFDAQEQAEHLAAILDAEPNAPKRESAQPDEWRQEAREREEGKRALEFLRMQGYRRCDIAACNCPYWHGGNASERLNEIHEVLNDAGLKPHQKTAIVVIRELAEMATKRESITHEQRSDLIFHMNAAFAHKQQEISGFSNWAFKSMEAALNALEKAGYKINKIEGGK